MLPLGTTVVIKESKMVGVVCGYSSLYDYNIVRVRDNISHYTLKLFFPDTTLEVITYD